MKAFWAKIVAYFMAILAFFTGLFGLNKKPDTLQPEPTTVTEQVTQTKPRIVTTTDVFETGYPAEQAIDRLARLGFEGIDMGFDYWTSEGSPFGADSYLDWARTLRKHADEVGIPCTHAHAPYDAASSFWVERSIQASAVLGATYCVVHPIYSRNGKEITDAEEFISVNAEAIRQYLPLAEACGVVLLSENILWGASADPQIIARLVETVGSKWFGWCYDTGHAFAKGYGLQTLRTCAVVPLSVHLQDSNGGDDHLIPGDGKIDWSVCIETLNAIGYKGDCVLEAHHQSLYAPDDERDAILARLLETAKPLRDALQITA